MTEPTKRFFFNIVLVLLVLMPVWFALQYIFAAIVTHANPDPKWPHSTLFLYLVLGPQLLAGGAIHYLILRGIPRAWQPVWRRIAAIVSSIVIPLTVIVFARGDPGLLRTPDVLGTLTVALVVYGTLVRLPPRAA